MSFSIFRMALYDVMPVLNKGPIYNTFQIEESSGGMYDHLSGGLGTTGEANEQPHHRSVPHVWADERDETAN